MASHEGNPEQAPLPFAWGVLYAKPNPDDTPKMCQNCFMWSWRDRKCSIHKASLEVPHDAVCIPPESLVMADGTLKRADEIKVGTRVLTHCNRWRRVLDVMTRQFQGNLVQIKAKGLSPLTVTPEHPVYAIRRRSRWDNDAGRSWTVSPYRDVFEPEWIEAKDLNVRDIVLRASPDSQPVRKVGGEPDTDRSTARLFGYYVAEGCACKDGKIPFVFSHTERSYVNEVARTGKRVFGRRPCIAERLNKHSIAVTFHSKKASEWLSREFGASCDKKKFPEWLMRQPSSITKEALIGAWRGDGCFVEVAGARPNVDSRRMTGHYTTTSPLLAEQVSLLLRREGFGSSIQHNPQPKSRDGSIRRPWSRVYVSDQYDQTPLRRMVTGGDVRARGAARTRRRDGLWRAPIRQVKATPYDGVVYNFSVEEDQSYTLLGGTVHNCGYHVFGKPMETRMDHPGMDPVDPALSGFDIIPAGTYCGSCIYYEATSGDKGVCHGVAKASGVPPQPVDLMGCCARWEGDA